MRSTNVRADFTDLHDGRTWERPLQMTYDGRVVKLHGGPTGYESFEAAYYRPDPWSACAGTPGRWARCVIPAPEMERAARELGFDENDWHRGDWMQTYTGRRFYPLDPRSEEIDQEDIAHALSLLCRYGGHVDRFYSVAEHCVLMSEAVPAEHALAALLHDATEAYVCDVPRPLKLQLPGYREIEDRVWLAVALRFGLSPELPGPVADADNRILLTERNALMPRAGRWAQDGLMEPLPVVVTGWPPADAERYYHDRLEQLLSRAGS